MRRRIGLTFEAAEPQDAVRNADVLVTATGSSEPVFDGARLAPGTHINAVGSNLAQKRELDVQTLRRADRVVADSAEVARLESGDLLMNGFDWDGLEELGPIVAGQASGREADEITVFESHGLALEDLACAVRVLRRARELEIGAELPA
jgi:ornithine cyclodeaminase/alanine dehydrogenase